MVIQWKAFFRPGCVRESEVIRVCQDIADSLDERNGIDAIIIDISKAFDLVPHDRLLTKLAAWGVDWRVVVWVRELLVGRTESVGVEWQLTKEVRVTSGLPQRSVVGTLLFVVYINYIWRNIVRSMRLLADD